MRRVLAIGLVAFLALAVAGCKGDSASGDGGSKPKTKDDAGSTPTAPGAAEATSGNGGSTPAADAAKTDSSAPTPDVRTRPSGPVGFAGAKRVECLSNLRSIGTALHIAAAATRGAEPPDSLQELVDRKILFEDVLRCPFCDESRTSDYFYLKARATDPAMRMVACDIDAHPDGGRCVLFVDGHVETLSAEKFKERLAEAVNQPFAEAFAKATAKQDTGRSVAE